MDSLIHERRGTLGQWGRYDANRSRALKANQTLNSRYNRLEFCFNMVRPEQFFLVNSYFVLMIQLIIIVYFTFIGFSFLVRVRVAEEADKVGLE